MHETTTDRAKQAPGGRSGPTTLKQRLDDPATLGLEQPPRWSILGAFLAVDVVLIAAHVINLVTIKQDFLKINVEFGLGESFQYAKFLAIAVVMAALARRTGRLGPALWGLVFAYLAADDAFSIHEVLGRSLARWWNLEEGAVVSQGAAGIAVAVVIAGVAFAAHRVGGVRGRVTALLAVGLVALGFFGVGVDAVHGLNLVSGNRFLNHTVRLIEEGGEMVAASFLVAFALWVLQDRTAPTPRADR